MSDSTTADHDVLIVGGGVAGLTAAVYTARAGLDTLVVNDEEPILKRNAHLENVPGFPAGVNSRLFLEMLADQATRNGAELRTARVTELTRATGGAGGDDSAETEAAEGDDPLFEATVEPADGGDGDASSIRASYVVAASWADASYLDSVGVELRDAGSKRYVRDDGEGRTNVEGVYAAGRLAERYHQTVVAAGDGAEVAITLIHDSDVPFYHDWVAPEGYFTDRGREVPPGCEEIDADEQREREAESMAVMREYFSDSHDEQQRTHPSLVDDERGRLPSEEWEND